MKHISSRENPAVKALAKLAGTAGKRGAPVLLDGVHLCQAWLQHHGAPDQAIFDVDRLSQPDIAALAAAVPEARCLALDARLMQSLASVESGQGVAFLVTPPILDMPATVEENCVLFDRIQDPGNVGTLLRTCAAAGVKRVFLATGTAAAWSPKVLRSGQGAHFSLSIYEHVDLTDLLAQLRVPLVATALDGAQNLYSGSLPQRCAWVFGHEGQGVAPALLAVASLKVCIPHDMDAVESLNVGAAAAVCLFEQRRQALAAPGR
ncbi:TrmH family RNA methyltransferase [Achromobacter spanius]|uniref:RNA methyltransferase n=1 Tax=Achromobacter spanius TaxID=217203 RepID=A0AA42LT87_9BURK|nr:RNA methyltransferase [Achromobacter spanius]MDH0739152.1 RNA methyltransferase [Achromobacter spanius]